MYAFWLYALAVHYSVYFSRNSFDHFEERTVKFVTCRAMNRTCSYKYILNVRVDRHTKIHTKSSSHVAL